MGMINLLVRVSLLNTAHDWGITNWLTILATLCSTISSVSGKYCWLGVLQEFELSSMTHGIEFEGLLIKV